MEQSFNTLCRHFYENAFFNQILLHMVQNQTEMMNSLSVIKRAVEGIAGVEGGVNVTGVGAMEEESSGFGRRKPFCCRGIRELVFRVRQGSGWGYKHLSFRGNWGWVEGNGRGLQTLLPPRECDTGLWG